MTPSESGEKVSQSKVPLVLLPQKACFRTFEGPENLSGPYTALPDQPIHNEAVKTAVTYETNLAKKIHLPFQNILHTKNIE